MGFLNLIFLLVLLSSLADTVVSVHNTSIEVDVEALKAFKSGLTPDSVHVLADWTDKNHHCNWTGISCDPLSGRVVSVSLPGMQLKGEISPFLGNISSLQVLDLESNSFTGSIPRQLARCVDLGELVLYDNSLSGSIPVELGYLKNLQVLDLVSNVLNGSIPDSICNSTSLQQVAFSLNNLTEFAYRSKVSTKADVFSFGVVVMELLTLRRPTGTIEDNGFPVTLHQFVEATLANGLSRIRQVIGPDFLLSELEVEKMINLLQLALSCMHPYLESRPEMDKVLSFLLGISESKQTPKADRGL